MLRPATSGLGLSAQSRCDRINLNFNGDVQRVHGLRQIVEIDINLVTVFVDTVNEKYAVLIKNLIVK